jgi:hypothetical protein
MKKELIRPEDILFSRCAFALMGLTMFAGCTMPAPAPFTPPAKPLMQHVRGPLEPDRNYSPIGLATPGRHYSPIGLTKKGVR